MTYHFEQLGPERFQQFAQALILIENPGLQCLPVAQPDGGRDAFLSPYFSSTGGLIVFQVKYARAPSAIDDPHKWIVDQMSQEAPKMARLLPKGVNKYYLVTNVKGTSHLDVGSIDLLQEILNEHLPVPAMAWWRDDLDRRVDVAPSSLRWSYPELLRGTDVLELLVDSDLGEHRRRRADILKAFITDQYQRDEEVRFKQVELQNDLLRLFIDVPAIVTKSPGDRRAKFDDHMLLKRIFSKTVETPRESKAVHYYLEERQEPVGAAALLLDELGQQRFQFVVIEGAPGQGKSTLAQFICQVYRIRLRDEVGLRSLHVAHHPKSVRLPIRIDLTEYAAWQSGKNPFSTDSDEHSNHSGSRRLESFIAALICEGSGGGQFTVDDLHAVFRNSLVLLVLDGLDEVAETRRRDLVIKEINVAARRLRELAPGIQVVVTTRPSAFAGVSDFAQRMFHHFQLASLGVPMIADYAQRWTAAKKISSQDAAAIRRGLQSRLAQPHVRDLATNPMQLAILLSVIHSRGTSLPDKRTALYDIYVELFLARESEKTVEVREHNELLVDVHRFLAYTLHSQAEAGGHLGRIGYENLMEILRSYLKKEKRNPALAEELFAGAQRVVFLVARVEGTFEFEVQPLREYFAGRYLYDTSPYSPPGDECGGTMPDRFDALSRNPYWLNVTRFFAGSLNKGELPALVDRLQALTDDPEYSYISYPRFLAATLLADWVFSQHQRSLHAVVGIVLDGPGLRALIRGGSSTRQDVLVLPSGAGRAELIQGAFQTLDSLPEHSNSFFNLTDMLQSNAAREELLDCWLPWYNNSLDTDKAKWFSVAYYLGILGELGADFAIASAIESGAPQSALLLFRARRYDLIEKCVDLFESLLNNVMDGAYVVAKRGNDNGLARLMAAFSPHWRSLVFNSGAVGDFSLDRWVGAGDTSPLERRENSCVPCDSGLAEPVGELIQLVDEVSQLSIDEWRRSVKPWSRLVEPARKLWGSGRRTILQTALAASSARDALSPSERALGLLDADADLCTRLRAARLRAGNVSWWSKQLDAIASAEDARLAVAMFLLSAGPTTVNSLIGKIDSIVRTSGDGEINTIRHLLLSTADAVSPWMSRGRLHVRALPPCLSDRCVALLGFVTPKRIQGELLRRYLASYSGSNATVKLFCVSVLVTDIITAGDTATREQWLELIRLVELSGDWDEGYLVPLTRRSSSSRTYGLPVDLAREVAKAGSLPEALLTLAEQVCEMNTFEDSEPLAEVARREDWFSRL